MFLIKKMIASFIMPLPLGLALLALGLVLLFFTQKQKAGKVVVALGTTWILLLSTPWLGQTLLTPLENNFSPLEKSIDAQYIHVLGGGLFTDNYLPLSSKLSHSALERTIEGVHQHGLNPNSKLIFSGYGATANTTTATLNSLMAMQLGVSKESIQIFNQPKDTAEEAEALKQFLIDQQSETSKVILVTSASHMPRAIGSFKLAGINVIAAPVDYRAKTAAGLFQPPQSRGLAQSETAFYELMGRLLYWLKS